MACEGLSALVLRARLEVEDGGGDGQVSIVNEMHVHGDDTPVVSRDAVVVAEEDKRVTSEGRLIDLVVDEGVTAVRAAGQGQPCARVFVVAAVVEDYVQRAVYG